MGLSIETEEGLSHLERLAPVSGFAKPHLPLAIAARTMRIDSQKMSFEMATSAAQTAQSNLQVLSFANGVFVKELVDGFVGGDEWQAIGQFEALLA